MRLYITIRSDKVFVSLPPVNDPQQGIQADAPPIPIRPGGNYLGISYVDLRSAGEGEHEFPEPTTLSL